jgi:hypothetical protein
VGRIDRHHQYTLMMVFPNEVMDLGSREENAAIGRFCCFIKIQAVAIG